MVLDEADDAHGRISAPCFAVSFTPELPKTNISSGLVEVLVSDLDLVCKRDQKKRIIFYLACPEGKFQ